MVLRVLGEPFFGHAETKYQLLKEKHSLGTWEFERGGENGTTMSRQKRNEGLQCALALIFAKAFAKCLCSPKQDFHQMHSVIKDIHTFLKASKINKFPSHHF